MRDSMATPSSGHYTPLVRLTTQNEFDRCAKRWYDSRMAKGGGAARQVPIILGVYVLLLAGGVRESPRWLPSRRVVGPFTGC
jgi:hypothetical protein